MTIWKVACTLSDMESDGTASGPAGAAAQLAALQAGRDQVAGRARQPWWYDPALGLCVFLLFAGLATDTIAGILVGIVVFSVGVRLLMNAYRRATGFWVSGLREGRTRRAIAGWFAVYALVVAPALVSRWWTTIYIAELTERP